MCTLCNACYPADMQVFDEEGLDRTPKPLVQRQMVPTRQPPQALPSVLAGGARPTGSILGRSHRESRMSSRVSKLSATPWHKILHILQANTCLAQ